VRRLVVDFSSALVSLNSTNRKLRQGSASAESQSEEGLARELEFHWSTGSGRLPLHSTPYLLEFHSSGYPVLEFHWSGISLHPQSTLLSFRSHRFLTFRMVQKTVSSIFSFGQPKKLNHFHGVPIFRNYQSDRLLVNRYNHPPHTSNSCGVSCPHPRVFTPRRTPMLVRTGKNSWLHGPGVGGRVAGATSVLP
jgi:hypothetical protein